jgi:2-(1,2-epoxy-1,2-dihydrophenyl)acetyl-CoA isomerase
VNTTTDLAVTRADHIVTVTLNRPEKRNAMTPAMLDALLATFTEVSRNPQDRVMVLTGAGGAFCSGADLSGVEGAESPLSQARFLGSVVLALHRIPKPVIAKVTGAAVGAGCNLALGCDLIVASENAKFSEIFSKRGLSLDFGGSWVLPRLVGMHRAKQLAFLGDMLSAQEALDIGIVNRVVASDEIDGVVHDWARRLAAGPPIALSLTKTMINNSHAVSIDQALEDEARCLSINLSTDDASEAMQAFFDKREPQFQGR